MPDLHTEERTVYIPHEGGDNILVSTLADISRTAREGYRLVSAEDGHKRLVLKFARDKHDKPAPVMRKAS